MLLSDLASNKGTMRRHAFSCHSSPLMLRLVSLVIVSLVRAMHFLKHYSSKGIFTKWIKVDFGVSDATERFDISESITPYGYQPCQLMLVNSHVC